MAEVRLERLRKSFGTTEVIVDLTLTIRDGELFTIVGPSGCGKSTLLHLIAGLEAPTTGRVIFDGQDVTAREPRERDVALVFQSYALYPHMTVGENLAFPLRVARRKARMEAVDIKAEVQRIAILLGLESLLSRHPRELSGGQRQRVALGRALIRKPLVFLLDEPMSNLDAQLRASMRTELRRLHDQLGITMIYVTHDQTEAMMLADRLAFLDQGRVQQVGTPRELYDEPSSLSVARFIGYPSMNLFDGHVRDATIRSGPFVLSLPPDFSQRGLQGGTRVTIGIRPEHILVTPKDVGPSGDASKNRGAVGVLRFIEQTGGQMSATVEVSEAAGVIVLVGLVEQGFQGRPGETVQMSIQRSGILHLFDPVSGLKVGTRAEGVSAHDSDRR
jgi:ABC-type sugar transport system ATPase subunit